MLIKWCCTYCGDTWAVFAEQITDQKLPRNNSHEIQSQNDSSAFSYIPTKMFISKNQKVGFGPVNNVLCPYNSSIKIKIIIRTCWIFVSINRTQRVTKRNIRCCKGLGFTRNLTCGWPGTLLNVQFQIEHWSSSKQYLQEIKQISWFLTWRILSLKFPTIAVCTSTTSFIV
jgi:hypothetical protein